MRLSDKYLKMFYPIKVWAVDTLYETKVYKYRDMYFIYDRLDINITPNGVMIGDVYFDNTSNHIMCEITSVEFRHVGGYGGINIHSQSIRYNEITSGLSVEYFLRKHTLYERSLNLCSLLSTNIKKHKFV